ncbi:MAG: tRNA (N(6)-L-threonylcarbamoyladenosine(37)-C(2))-methylthiotransferase MtaB [Candidatus Omnitrophota bacterium]
MKTFYIRTLGCKVNQCDSLGIREKFLSLGWQESPKNAKADVCIVNTCCVTHHADRKSRNAISSVVRGNPAAKIVVTGCYASYDRSAIEGIEGIAAVFENDKKEELFRWAQGLSLSSYVEGGRVYPVRSNMTRGFLKIQDGCSNSCSYCIVPLVRGPSKSKEPVRILSEARHLVGAGHKEIVLTGVCLGSFGKDLSDKEDIVDIITRLEEIEGLARIRLSSIEAGDVTDRLINKMSGSKKLMPHLHIPFQSGDDRVLEAMNKRLRVGDYSAIVDKAKAKIEDLAITCDFIVGYPQEDEKSFKNTLKFLDFVKPLKTHIFSYSPRLGTLSCRNVKMPDAKVVKERYTLFKQKAEEIAADYKKSYIGREMAVLFEIEKMGVWQGHTGNYMLVKADIEGSLKGDIRRVLLTGIEGDSVIGKELT